MQLIATERMDTELTTESSRVIALIDLDSFYASAEIARKPSLKSEPVIIGADPKEGSGRGVVLTCNYVARKFGVRSAMPISQAWKLCPKGIYLPPDFSYYETLSSQVMQIIKSRAERYEQVSIDEAFADLSKMVDSMDSAQRWVVELKRELLEKTGLTCSVGVAENKSAAKIAADLKKPDGITVVPRGGIKDFLKPLPIKAIAGVGLKTELLLRNLGFNTIGDLQGAEVDSLRRHLGKAALWLLSVANGLESEDVQEHELKSLSTERTFEEDSSDWSQIERVMGDLSGELATRVSEAHLLFKKVGIKIRFQGFETHTRESTLPSLVSDQKILQREALSLVREFREKGKKVRLVGLRVSDLEVERVDQARITSWLEERVGGSGGPQFL